MDIWGNVNLTLLILCVVSLLLGISKWLGEDPDDDENERKAFVFFGNAFLWSSILYLIAYIWV